MANPTRDDVLLCLQLYEQRRDPALREARDWMVRFAPSSFDDIRGVMFGQSGADANRCWRQASSYWEMIAALMMSGGVSPEARELFTKTTREFALCFSKVEPYLVQIREATTPAAFQHLEQFCTSMPDYENLRTYFRSVNERIRAMNAAEDGKAQKAGKRDKKDKAKGGKRAK
jgi:hypothetical protein